MECTLAAALLLQQGMVVGKTQSKSVPDRSHKVPLNMKHDKGVMSWLQRVLPLSPSVCIWAWM